VYHHHGIYHARRCSSGSWYIIDKLKAEGEKAYITKEDPKVIMARIVQRWGIAVCSLKRCVPMYCKATESLIMDILQTYLSPQGTTVPPPCGPRTQGGAMRLLTKIYVSTTLFPLCGSLTWIRRH
jgi:hypothetical protein